jgi:energy-converting hydrogenase A subunit M
MTHALTAWLAFNAGVATPVLWRYWCERRMDRDADLCAVMDATSETPLYDALLLEDWRREVWTLADLELAELVEEEGS